jgi:hypothetical protein
MIERGITMKPVVIWVRYLLLFSGVLISSLACGLLQGSNSSAKTIPPGDLSGIPSQPVPPVQPSPTQMVPQENPTATQMPALQPNAYFNGISFVYDLALTKGVKAFVVDATGPASDQQPIFAVNPREDQFDFQGYTVASPINAQMEIFSVKEYEALAGDQVTPNVNNLKKLLAVRPKDFSGNLPNLPFGNASMVFHSQMQYIKFQNGSGIRFLTQFAQDVSPISNDRLVYVFQGITDDGAYYISAMLPITHPSLPANYDEAMQGQDPQKFSENFVNYLLDVQNKLNEQKGDSFKPTLEILDNMLSTIKIDK